MQTNFVSLCQREKKFVCKAGLFYISFPQQFWVWHNVAWAGSQRHYKDQTAYFIYYLVQCVSSVTVIWNLLATELLPRISELSCKPELMCCASHLHIHHVHFSYTEDRMQKQKNNSRWSLSFHVTKWYTFSETARG